MQLRTSGAIGTPVGGGESREFFLVFETQRLLQCGDWGGTNLLLIVQRPETATEYLSAGPVTEDWIARTETPRIMYLRTKIRRVSRTRLTGYQDW